MSSLFKSSSARGYLALSLLILSVVYVTVYHVHGFLLEKAVFFFIQLPEPLQALFGDDQMARNYDRKRVQAYGVRNGAHAGGLTQNIGKVCITN